MLYNLQESAWIVELLLKFLRTITYCFSFSVFTFVSVYADAGLRFDPISGPLLDHFSSNGSSSLARGFLLLPTQGIEAPQYEISIDSSRVQFRRLIAGFPDGLTVNLSVDEYLNLEFNQQAVDVWKRELRRSQRQTVLNQLGRRNSRFEWTVPYAAPKPLRRLIGDEGASLRLNGSRTIVIGGKSEWTVGEVQTSLGRSSKFPALSIDQESKFSVEGKVGELINVRIDQDTESVGSAFSSNLGDQIANQIKLDYKGEDDAIFQEIQAGNTTLELPATRFVGFRQQNKGLFGIRAKGHLGPLAFTTIASHEKSKSNRQTFKGGVAADTLEVRDYQYLRNTYFFLHEFYRANLTDFRSLSEGAQFSSENFVDVNQIEVYINDFNTNNDAETFAKPGEAWVDPSDVLDADVNCFGPDQVRLRNSGCYESGTWQLLDPDQEYTVISEAGYIIMERPINERYALAVRYKTNDPDFDGLVQRENQRLNVAGNDSLVLKLIKPRNARPGFPTWNLEWKNVYRIASGYGIGRKFDPKILRIDVVKEEAGREDQPSQDGRAFIQLMGLDQRGQDPGSPADRIIDPDYIGLDELRGHLIFPDQFPFAPKGLPYKGLLKEEIPGIYNTQQQRDQTEASRYKLLVRSMSSEQRIRLGGIFGGVRSETVEVRLNGRSLNRGTDYNVDFIGNVTFVGNVAQEVSDPGADLEISFESEDVFGLGSQQKTLLGLRSEYEFWAGDGRLGSTLLYNNERSNERRVRVGTEPTRSITWNLDLRARRDVPFLTRAIDRMPLIKTAETSEVVLDAEVAQSRPNLNTKGLGYIDDFEGSERPTNISIGRTRWVASSIPGEVRFSEKNMANFSWYNPYDGVSRIEIWPNQEEQIEAQNRNTDILALQLEGDPNTPTYWGGVMTALTTVNDFSQSKFLEVWVRGEEGMLYVELGDQISEDFVPNGKLDTEDSPFPGRTTGDGVVSREEDSGLDGRNDEEELNHYLRIVQADYDTTKSLSERKADYVKFYSSVNELFSNQTVDDPEGDNWKYDAQRNKNDYSRINGTQGNKVDLETGDRPDTEDLNNNGVLDQRNNYYQYGISLSDNRYEVSGTRSNGWRQLRLPLYGEEVSRIGLPDSTRIEFARLILVGEPRLDSEDPYLAEIALIEIVGNEWQEDPIVQNNTRFPIREEEVLDITVIGTDKSQQYKPPPGVKIRRNAQSRTREREQSLVLAYQQIEPGHQMSATRILSRAVAYTNYERLRMFVHGDSTNKEYIQGDESILDLFVRFGSDSTNYYEVISPVFPGWDGQRKGWDGNEVNVDLLVMAQLKALLESDDINQSFMKHNKIFQVINARGAPIEGKKTLTDTEVDQLRVEGYNPEIELIAIEREYSRSDLRDGEPCIYRVRGRPSMQSIRQLSIGVRNRGRNKALTGKVFVNELRLDEARNNVGLAAFARVNTKLADFINLDTQVEWKEQDFRSVNSDGGNSADHGASIQATTQLHKLLPGSWGLSIPLKVNLNRSTSLPRFGPGSDVELTKKEKKILKSKRSKEFFDIAIRKRPGKNLLIRWTMDQMNLRFSHSNEYSSDPVRPVDRQEAQTFNFGYQMPLPKPSLNPFSWLPKFTPESWRAFRMRPLPSSASYSLVGNRRYIEKLQRGDADTTSQEDFGLNEIYSTKLNLFTGLSADYNLKIDRDLRKKLDPKELSFGREIGRRQTADVSLTLRFIRWLDQNYTFKSSYNEQNDPSQRRGGVVIDSTNGRSISPMDIDAKHDLSARLSFKLPTILRDFGQEDKKDGGGSDQSDTFQRNIEDALLADSIDVFEHKNKRRSPFVLKRLSNFLGKYVEPINANWRRDTSARNFNLTERPSFAYQVGLDDSVRVDRALVGLTTQDSRSRGVQREANSGIRMPLGISVKINLREQENQRSGSAQTRLRVTKEQSFPRINLTWGRADRIPYVKRFVNSAQVNFQYEKKINREGEGSLRLKDLLTRGNSREIRVSWNGRWRWGPTTNLEHVISQSVSSEYELSSADSIGLEVPPLRGSSSSDLSSTKLTLKYDVKPRSLPIFGKLKSNITLNYEIGISSEVRSNGTSDEIRTPITEQGAFKTQLSMTYKFSDNFRGMGLLRWENNDNRLTDKVRKTREIKLSGTFFLR